MPNSDLVQICDAVVTHLAAQSLSKTFSVEKDYLPDFERERLTSTQVTVYPQSTSVAFASRTTDQLVYSVNIVIRSPVAASANPDISEELYFAQELRDSLDRVTMSNASFTAAQSEPAYDLETLNERNEFLTVITATYLQIK
tara:strand:- start:2081 stop:2506 length:426 start_codon:yes stop_codon:yes gene_type:complete